MSNPIGILTIVYCMAPDQSRRDALLALTSLGAISGCLSASSPSGESQTAGSGATADIPRLTVDGTRLVTAEGRSITLRGVSIVDPKRGSTTPARGQTSSDVVARLTDADAGWYPTVIRVPVQPIDIGDTEHGVAPTPPAFTQAQLEQYLTTYLDPVIAQCAERNVYAIIDYHRHNEGIAWGSRSDETITTSLQAEARLFWDTVAPRYAEDSHVLYEVYNEPASPTMEGTTSDPDNRATWRLFLEFIQPIVETIRTHTDTVTIVGSPGWSTNPDGALIEPVAGDNLAYSYHIYPGHEVSKATAWDGTGPNGGGVDSVYEEYPLFVTEFGWRNHDDELLGGTTTAFGEPILQWVSTHPEISWTAWCADVWWDPAMFRLDPETGAWILRAQTDESRDGFGEVIKNQLATAANESRS